MQSVGERLAHRADQLQALGAAEPGRELSRHGLGSEHLDRVLQNISKVKGVYKAVRGRGRTGGKMELDHAPKEELH